MALQTPRQRLQRPSYGTANSAEKQSSLSASTAVNRKASLRALTGQLDPRTPSGNINKMEGAELEVSDTVNVPGDMYGTVKFIGTVRGKNGRFVGVELDREFAARGKNDGDVDGVHYFNTTVPGAGIFLPVHRAEKRFSPAGASVDEFPTTPNTPSYSTINGNGIRTKGGENAYTPPTPAVPSKFSQTVGHGAQRPTSPQFKPKRPSLPRPESPLRRPPNLAPTPARALSQSTRGGRPVLASSTTTPSRTNLKASTSRAPPSNQTPRPYSRTGSRLGHRQQPDSLAEEFSGGSTSVGLASTSNGRTTSTSSVPSFSQPLRSPSRLGSAGGISNNQHDTAELQRLRKDLADRDRRLEEQANSLAEMEASVKELSALLPSDGITPGGGTRKASLGDDEDQTTAQLRQLLREKNEKISLLTQDFDAHRADFRSTLDSLEMASTETERVYEEQKRDLLAQLSDLHSQNEALQHQNETLQQHAEAYGGSSKEDFEGVAQQLKQLEELVAELEEGLEESRRGEAEARGEVEFLRGEVERGRSELKREREKSAKAGSGGGRELEQREDEVRGLKAIIHSLSSGSNGVGAGDGSKVSGAVRWQDEDVKRLETALDESQREKEDLEKELERLRMETATSNGNTHTRNESERTATAPDPSTTERPIALRQRSGTLKPTFAEHARRSGLDQDLPDEEEREDEAPEANGAEEEGTPVFCEMCESREHDTVDCPVPHTSDLHADKNEREGSGEEGGVESPGKENEDVPAHTNGNGKVSEGKVAEDEDKWCALCEKDGHLAFDCPEEQY